MIASTEASPELLVKPNTERRRLKGTWPTSSQHPRENPLRGLSRGPNVLFFLEPLITPSNLQVEKSSVPTDGGVCLASTRTKSGDALLPHDTNKQLV